MIRLENLKKDYVVGKKITKALKGVSFTLPDTGMVFIVGKSGSGKSTLMNILGGLDDATSGSFFIDGVDITKLKDRKLDEYRNNYVGIIYQNFNLFPNESVAENIRTAGYISKRKIKEADVNNMLEQIDMLDKKHVLTKNLSGGQRQRVAIARALIKKPQLILADEPTGNLDSKTTKTIFEVLKELSKEKLVVIISHDNSSANEYADRIIRLKDGEVIEDKIRNKEFDNSNIIKISSTYDISDEKLEALNKTLTIENVSLVKDDMSFISFDGEVTSNNNEPNLKGKVQSAKSVFKLSNKLFKSGLASFIFTTLVLTFLISILSFSQSFIQFDGTNTMNEVAKDYNTKNYVLNKSYSEYGMTSKINKDQIHRIEDSDIQAIKDTGYQGNIYPIYSTYILNRELYNFENFESIEDDDAYADLYSSIGLGTIVCDENYLDKIFGEYGENGKAKVLAGSLNDIKDNSKIIVTDYYADSIIMINKMYSTNKYESNDPNDPYQKIVNTKLGSRYTIGAVINTNYKERYKTIFDIRNQIIENPQSANKLTKVIYNLEEYTLFLTEANSSLNYSYSINPNFKEAYTSSLTFNRFENAILYSSSGSKYPLIGAIWSNVNNTLKEGEMILSSLYTSLLSDEEIEKINNKEDVYLYLDMYDLTADTISDAPLLQKEFKVVSIANSNKENLIGYFSKEDSKQMNDITIIEYGIVLDDVSNLYDVSQIAQKNYLYTTITIFTPIFDVFNTIEVFNGLFFLIAILIVIIMFLTIMSYNLRLVKKNQYRIGVYRGLGYSTSTISFASFVNLIYLMIGLTILSVVACKYTDYLVNKIIVDSFALYLDSDIIKNYQLIDFSMNSLFVYLGVIFAVSFISMISPILYIRNLKPNIILNKVD